MKEVFYANERVNSAFETIFFLLDVLSFLHGKKTFVIFVPFSKKEDVLLWTSLGVNFPTEDATQVLSEGLKLHPAPCVNTIGDRKEEHPKIQKALDNLNEGLRKWAKETDEDGFLIVFPIEKDEPVHISKSSSSIPGGLELDLMELLEMALRNRELDEDE